MLNISTYSGLIVLGGLSATLAAQEVPKQTPGSRELFVAKCTICHQEATATSQQHSEAEWAGIMQRMVENGAKMNDAEKATILKYLTALYGPANPDGLATS